jgi:hypothetical protein
MRTIVGGKLTRKRPNTCAESIPAFAAPDVAERIIGQKSELTTILTKALYDGPFAWELAYQPTKPYQLIVSHWNRAIEKALNEYLQSSHGNLSI